MSILKSCGYTLNSCGYTGKVVDILKKLWIYCYQVLNWSCGYTVKVVDILSSICLKSSCKIFVRNIFKLEIKMCHIHPCSSENRGIHLIGYRSQRSSWLARATEKPSEPAQHMLLLLDLPWLPKSLYSPRKLQKIPKSAV